MLVSGQAAFPGTEKTKEPDVAVALPKFREPIKRIAGFYQEEYEKIQAESAASILKVVEVEEKMKKNLIKK